MVSYGLDDLDSSDSEDELEATLGSPLAGRQAPVARPRVKPRVSFVDLSPVSSAPVSPSKLLPRANLYQLSDEEDSDDSSFDEPVPSRRIREYSVDDAEDSEEELWPVDPPRPKVHLSKLDVLATDPWSLVEEAERAKHWSAVNLAFSRNLKALRTKQDAAAEAVRRRRAAQLEAEEAEIAALLQSLTIHYDADAEKAAREFEERNKQLWESINATIAATEQLAVQRAAELEAERKAKEAQELAEQEAKAEQKRKLEERAAKEKAELERKQKQAEAAEQERAKVETALREQVERAAGSAREWQRWADKMKSIKTDVLPVVSEDTALRKLCSQAKRQITPKVGQLVNTRDSVSSISARLHELLSGAQNTSPVAYTWSLNHLAKSLIRQAETEVTAKQSVAFPLARVVVGLLLNGHGELADVLMARLVKKCFWVAAWYPRKPEGVSEEVHLKMLGHTVAGESSVQYSERMAGILALYAAILQTSPVESPQAPSGISREQAVAAIPPHFRPDAGWTWLIQILQPPLVGLEPVPNLLETFLSVAGAGLHEVFGRQFVKLLVCLHRDGLQSKVFSEKSRASQIKMSLLLEDWLKLGKIPDPPGRALEAPEAFD